MKTKISDMIEYIEDEYMDVQDLAERMLKIKPKSENGISYKDEVIKLLYLASNALDEAIAYARDIVEEE